MSAPSSQYQQASGQFRSSQHQENIFYKILYPKEFTREKCVHLYFCHGAVEYHERHLDFISKFFAHSEYNIIINFFDLVGHGHSGGSRVYIQNFSDFCLDYIQLMNELESKYQLQSLYPGKTVFGSHSLGGLITLKILLDFKEQIPFKPCAAFYSNPCLYPTLKIPKPIESIMHKLKYGFEKIRIPSFYSASDITSLEPLAYSFENDPMISKFMTLALAREIIRETRHVKGLAYYIDVPSLFLLSKNDVIVDPKGATLFVKGIDKELSTLRIYKHSAHDLFNDKEASLVEEDIRKWLSKVL